MLDTSKLLPLVSKSFDFKIGENYIISPTYWQAIAIVFLLFVLVLTLAQFRRHMLDWSAKGAIFGVFFGFIFAVILEGFMLISGRSVLTELLGWRNAPKPVQNVLEVGRERLIKVLGTSVSCAP